MIKEVSNELTGTTFPIASSRLSSLRTMKPFLIASDSEPTDETDDDDRYR